jgi:hypothetical protein
MFSMMAKVHYWQTMWAKSFINIQTRLNLWPINPLSTVESIHVIYNSNSFADPKEGFLIVSGSRQDCWLLITSWTSLMWVAGCTTWYPLQVLKFSDNYILWSMVSPATWIYLFTTHPMLKLKTLVVDTINLHSYKYRYLYTSHLLHAIYHYYCITDVKENFS